MKFELPKLKYSYDALEPVMDKATVEIHYSKHHQAYVNNLNNALEGLEFDYTNLVDLLKSVDKLPESIRQSVINNGGGHFNHSLFWDILSPQPQSFPTEKLAQRIVLDFGSFDEFKKSFEAHGLKHFGSGWVWLIKKADTSLQIVTLPNQNPPLSLGIPILGVDLWEHAYYLKYQNKRAEYLTNIWKLIDWKVVESYYNK